MKPPKQNPPVKFPLNREEFAGDLTPDILPGPVTKQHRVRFHYRDLSKPDPVEPQDPGVK